ncbi:unnamed protein product [Closterium sp. Naga37s-1]|nr:unnamed protein product [Closterium sp. Naga37s-1]
MNLPPFLKLVYTYPPSPHSSPQNGAIASSQGVGAADSFPSPSAPPHTPHPFPLSLPPPPPPTPACTVRSRAAKALGRLTALNPRVDALISDLLNSIQNTDGAVKESMAMAIRGVTADGAVKESMLMAIRGVSADGAVKESMPMAIRGVVRHGGKAASPASLERLSSSLQAVLFASDSDDDSVVRSVAARALGGTAQAVLFASDSDDDSVVRSVAARALGGNAQYLSEPDYLTLLSALATPLPSSRPWSHRLAAALALSSQLLPSDWKHKHLERALYLSEPDYLCLLAALAAPLPSSRPWSHRLAAALALSSLLRHTASRPAPLPASQLTSVAEKSAAAIRAHAGDDKVPVRETAAKEAGRWLMLFGMGGGSAGGVVSVLASLLGDAASDVRRKALSAVKMVAKKVGQWGQRGQVARTTPFLLPAASDVRRRARSAVKMVAKKVSGLMGSKGSTGSTCADSTLLLPAASDVRRKARSAVKMVAKKEPIPAKLLAALGPPLSECLKYTSHPEPIPAKLLASLGPPLSECLREPIPAKLMAALGPPLSECLKDTSQPVRMAAERTILHAFQLSKGEFQLSAVDGSDDNEDDDAQDD